MIFDAITFAVAFAIGAALYPLMIRLLRRMRSGQVIQQELPDSHQKKAGTPTGGGILFVVMAGIGGILAAMSGHDGAEVAMLGLACGGLIGAADDQAKLAGGSIGIPARAKLPVQLALALPVTWFALGGIATWQQQVWLPLPAVALFVVAWIGVVGAANAVNITDGMDGLAAGLSIIAVGTVALFLPSAPAGEKAVAMTLCGALAAFLIYNRYPARVFMGDTGALAIGFALAAMAIQQGWLILLPLVGLVFVLETLSVIIQVAYFKASGGRRIFKMTPIHYTFHHEGWSENRIALSFWGAGLVSALAAVGVARLAS
jgi:phospho-N-acetylmuramoyl-pentapeptide-transferase